MGHLLSFEVPTEIEAGGWKCQQRAADEKKKREFVPDGLLSWFCTFYGVYVYRLHGGDWYDEGSRLRFPKASTVQLNVRPGEGQVKVGAGKQPFSFPPLLVAG